MSRHRDHRTVPPRFPLDPWTIRERGFDPAEGARNESIFALGNGYVGVRGTLDEGAPVGALTVPGTYLNGFHERQRIGYAENAYGYARWRQTMLNVIDATEIEVRVDGERVGAIEGRARDHVRELDLRAGVLRRSLVWTGADGRRTRLRFLRAVSMVHARRVALRVEVEPLDGPVRIELVHVLDGHVENLVETGDPRVGSALQGRVLRPVVHRHDERGRRLLRARAPGSGMELVCASEPSVEAGPATDALATEATSDPDRATFRVEGTLASSLRFDARVVYLDARDVPATELEAAAGAELDAYAEAGGVEELLREQRAWLDAFWRDADVAIEGDEVLQQAVRFALFHLVQGAGRDGRTNVASKALTGEGYEGHTFWDTEIYVLPVLLHVRPEIARALLRYRIGLLPAARDRARELHLPGALFPWRTIAGPEASGYYPAGTAQYHIDADVVHALRRYVEATGDRALLWEGGAAVAIECARLYAGLGSIGRDGAFHLHTVTGPDEYTALVSDNHYTNRMAWATLRWAARLTRELAEEDPARFRALREELELDPDEPGRWNDRADRMHLPVDPELLVTPQDASFLDKPEWPWDEVPEERYPLLLHYHPLDIYRHQVLKQADVLLAHYLLPDVAPRSRLRRDAAYYAPRTTHDSSLSPCVHAILAADLGDLASAEDHLRRTARMDLDDLNGNVADGVHAAAMGGTWLAVAQGFGGFRVRGGEPTFAPRLAAGWTRLRFRVAWRGARIEIDADRATTRYRLAADGDAAAPDAPVAIRHRGERLVLEPGAEVARPTGPRLRGVAFDLDGVLTDSAELHYRSWKRLADDLGVPFDREANEELRGIDRMGSLERILARGDRAWTDAEKADLAARKNAHYRTLLEDVGPADLMPGIAALLDALRDEGVPLALASSSRNGPAVIERLGIADRFDAVVDPASLLAGKPDPEIFERAAEALGLPPEDVVGIEDAAAGVAALRGAGMPAVGVGDAATLADAHVVVPTTAGLRTDVLRDAVARAAAEREDADRAEAERIAAGPERPGPATHAGSSVARPAESRTSEAGGTGAGGAAEAATPVGADRATGRAGDGR